MIDVATAKDDVRAYWAEPEGETKGGIIVIHEVWGLNDHTKDIADRLAREGYLALAPDLLSDTIDVDAAGALQEDYFNPDPEKRNEAQPKLRGLMTPMHNPSFGADTLAKIKGCFNCLYSQPETHEKVAIIGYCFGGTYSFSLAVNEPRLKLAMPFYGHANFTVEELKAIACPVRAFFGEKDENLMKALPELKQKMGEAGVDFEAKVYPDCGHAFFNDTNRFAYNETAATDAWQCVLEHLKQYVG